MRRLLLGNETLSAECPFYQFLRLFAIPQTASVFQSYLDSVEGHSPTSVLRLFFLCHAKTTCLASEQRHF